MVPILVIITQQSHIQTHEHLWKLTTSLWSGFFFQLKLKENTLLQRKYAGVHRKSTKRGSTKKNVELLSKTQI